mmetsp:Transcript_88246/g.263127  ORF Transcript_88246/g.263127 Transcript_88246/m.263127 type:complete len:215 (-) Transcript_88246:19-663(-)
MSTAAMPYRAMTMSTKMLRPLAPPSLPSPFRSPLKSTSSAKDLHFVYRAQLIKTTNDMCAREAPHANKMMPKPRPLRRNMCGKERHPAPMAEATRVKTLLRREPLPIQDLAKPTASSMVSNGCSSCRIKLSRNMSLAGGKAVADTSTKRLSQEGLLLSAFKDRGVGGEGEPCRLRWRRCRFTTPGWGTCWSALTARARYSDTHADDMLFELDAA